MRNKLITLVLLGNLVFGSAVYGTDLFWDGGGANNLWSTSENWDAGVPGSADGAIVDGGYNVLIDSTVAATASYAQIGRMGGTSTLTMTGGSLDVVNWELILGNWDGGHGVLNLSGGTVSANNVYIGNWGSGVLNMTGGVMDLVWSLQVGPQHLQLQPAHVQLDGGTIYADSLGIGTYGSVDITGTGKFVLAGNEDLSWYIANGYLTANGVAGDVLVNYNGTNTIVTAIPEPATLALLAIGGVFLRKRRA